MLAAATAAPPIRNAVGASAMVGTRYPFSAK
jgi:hypothetical protein